MFGYVLVSLKKTAEQNIYDDLKEMKEVKEVNILFGEWDLIVKLEIESAEELGSFVMSNIRNLPEVNLTSTMIVAK
ncbi:Lrp/AsnC ligand binding domain-containing protein [Candidatus Woesearchaeota archaeon]|nr:Lrp/AsnC ligand binding domain-containing protein [Candidatus Woesearchaeota archaeon]